MTDTPNLDAGQLEKATGKMTGNPEMVARGETRKVRRAAVAGRRWRCPHVVLRGMCVDSCIYDAISRWARWAGVSAPRRTRKHSSAGASKSTHSDIVAKSPVSCDRTSSRPVLVFVLVSLQLYECNGTMSTAVSAIVTRTRSDTELDPIREQMSLYPREW